MYACDMAIIERRIAENIEQIMTDKTMSMNALHDATGIPYNTLKTRIKSGRGLEVYELDAIATALGVNPQDLLISASEQAA